MCGDTPKPSRAGCHRQLSFVVCLGPGKDCFFAYGKIDSSWVIKSRENGWVWASWRGGWRSFTEGWGVERQAEVGRGEKSQARIDLEILPYWADAENSHIMMLSIAEVITRAGTVWFVWDTHFLTAPWPYPAHSVIFQSPVTAHAWHDSCYSTCLTLSFCC